MFSLYNFIFQRLIWKEISVYFYGLIIEFSRNEKLQKYRIIISQHTIYTNDWSPFWLVYCYRVYFFFCEITKHMQPKNRLVYLDWHFIECASMLTKLAGYDEYRLTGFHPIRIFLANKIHHFQGCLIKQAAFLPGQPVPCNQLLIQPLCLFQNAILRKMLKLGFWNFKPIFLKIQFSLVATFFFL